MKQLFELCDENKDGIVTKEELYKIMKKLNVGHTSQNLYIYIYN